MEKSIRTRVDPARREKDVLVDLVFRIYELIQLYSSASLKVMHYEPSPKEYMSYGAEPYLYITEGDEDDEEGEKTVFSIAIHLTDDRRVVFTSDSGYWDVAAIKKEVLGEIEKYAGTINATVDERGVNPQAISAESS